MTARDPKTLAAQLIRDDREDPAHADEKASRLYDALARQEGPREADRIWQLVLIEYDRIRGSEAAEGAADALREMGISAVVLGPDAVVLSVSGVDVLVNRLRALHARLVTAEAPPY